MGYMALKTSVLQDNLIGEKRKGIGPQSHTRWPSNAFL